MEQNNKTKVDSYMDSIPLPYQTICNKLRIWVQTCAPNAIETMSYGMPTYVYYGNLVHFAYQKKHLGFYPGPSGVTYASSLDPNIECSKGAIRFSYQKELPFELIQAIIAYRLNENKEIHTMKQSMKTNKNNK
jgi:uncharacterized protein YdhG (YjbR/CyaY superfamily)